MEHFTLPSNLDRDKDCRVAVVVCARDDEQTIGAVVAGALALGYRVAVMDGGSTDRTPFFARAAGAIVHSDAGDGVGERIRRGLDLFEVDIVVYVDGDGTYDPADIPRLVEPILEDRADLCVGSRFEGGGEELSATAGQLLRTLGSIAANVAINRRWNTRLSDTLNGFRAVRRGAAVAIGLEEHRHGIHPEMVVKMLSRGYRVVNVPTHEARQQKQGSVLKAWSGFARSLFSIQKWTRTETTVSRTELLPFWPRAAVALGLLLVCTGWFLPEDWFTFPSVQGIARTAGGFGLLRVSLGVEGVVLGLLGLAGWQPRELAAEDRLPLGPTLPAGPKQSRSPALWILALVTLVAIALRAFSLDSELWLEEIAAQLVREHRSALEFLSERLGANDHLLNFLLVKGTTALFGEREWAMRLPAAVFGAATVPVAYWFARRILSWRSSLAVALLLAVSYHHVFFSQNASGLTAYLLFSLLSTALLFEGLRTDRWYVWVLYGGATVANFASLLLSVYVFAAHIAIGVMAAMAVGRAGRSPLPLLGRLASVFAVTALLGLQVYALALPRLWTQLQREYVDPAAGYNLFSAEFVGEVARGIAAGFGSGLLLWALPFLALAGAGLIHLFRKNWVIALSLALPGVLLAGVLATRGLVLTPRYFLLALPLLILSSVLGIRVLAIAAGTLLGRDRRFAARLGATIVLAVAAVSLVSLKRYYATPKQAYRSSLQYAEAARRPNGIVIAVHLTEPGYRYYAARLGLPESGNYFYVRSEQELAAVVAQHKDRKLQLATTFSRSLHLSYPHLYAEIVGHWKLEHTFASTVGDGEISLWTRR